MRFPAVLKGRRAGALKITVVMRLRGFQAVGVSAFAVHRGCGAGGHHAARHLGAGGPPPHLRHRLQPVTLGAKGLVAGALGMRRIQSCCSRDAASDTGRPCCSHTCRKRVFHGWLVPWRRRVVRTVAVHGSNWCVTRDWRMQHQMTSAAIATSVGHMLTCHQRRQLAVSRAS